MAPMKPTRRKKNEEEEAAGGGGGAIPKTNSERVHRLDGDGLGRDKPNLEKDKSACGSCEGEVKSNQSGLQCDMCDRWFHCVCEKISSEEYKMLSREGSGTQWYCRPCRGQVKTLKDENEKLKEKK